MIRDHAVRSPAHPRCSPTQPASRPACHQAMEAYNAALAIVPTLSDVRTNLGDLWRAQVRLGGGQLWQLCLARDPELATT